MDAYLRVTVMDESVRDFLDNLIANRLQRVSDIAGTLNGHFKCTLADVVEMEKRQLTDSPLYGSDGLTEVRYYPLGDGWSGLQDYKILKTRETPFTLN